jgi:superfamily I DNA/RNA helicase
MPYQLLTYSDFSLPSVKQKYEKVICALQKGDFKSADVKKLQNTGYFRAKLDREARLLFRFVRFQNETYLLLLEILLHHEYDKSRFLRGAEIDEAKLADLVAAEDLPTQGAVDIRYLNPVRHSLHFLDKFISFDEDQNSILHLPVPLIIIGSAGSGKTALTLERLKMLKGNLAYISLSPFLVENAENLYYAQHYENERQEIDFLSFRDYLASFKIPEGKEIDFRAFEGFYARHRSQVKVKEPYKLFEEFKGVITGAVTDKPYLSSEEYRDLGVKQSVFTREQRPEVYELFKEYLSFLRNEGYYDMNILSHEYLEKVRPQYDYVIVDEVQDLTNIQLKIILQSLKNPVGFVLCGDANQIVHPNFFSWSALKSMFYKAELDTDIIRILHTNYRNAGRVTDFANRLLKIKNFRFGSIDKESTHLINSVSAKEGEVEFLEDKPKTKEELNRKTRNSTQYAVLVMNNEDKAEVRKFFNTPLIFSIQEAKGLEYENIILVNFISRYEKEFRVIAEGITPGDLAGDELVFSRNRDKENKELETYKFYINSLYAAMTRAVQNLYIIEGAVKHPMLQLLGLVKVKETTALKEVQSSLEDWNKEARKLELQGKKEQSEAIRQRIAKEENRIVLSDEELKQLKVDALNPAQFNNQAKKKLFKYAVSTTDFGIIQKLEALKFPEARKYFEKLDREFGLYVADCAADKINPNNRFIKQYGVNFRNKAGHNGLFPSAEAGALKSLKFLLDNGADRMANSDPGPTALQETIRIYSTELLGQIWSKKHGKPVRERHDAKSFGRVYELLKTHSLTIETDGRQLKINSHTMEYFLLNFMIGMTQFIQEVKVANIKRYWEERMKYEWAAYTMNREIEETRLGLSMDDIMVYLELMPSEILPDFRRKRQYVNSILSKNEIGRDDPYNRKLFQRTARGIYVVNPELKLLGY